MNPPPPILYRFKNELTDSRPVKTIKKEKYRFHCFNSCSVEVTSTVNVIILKIMFWNFKTSCLYLRGNREGKIVRLRFRL